MNDLEATYGIRLDKRDTALILGALRDKAHDAYAAAEASKSRGGYKSAADSEAYASVLEDIAERIRTTAVAHYERK